MNKTTTFRPEILPVLGSVFACLFWFIDSAIDTFIFKSQRLYLEDLLRPDSIELLSRCQVVILLMVLSFVAMRMLSKQQDITAKLRRYQLELEDIVDERTDDLRVKNIILEKEMMDRLKIEAELVQLATIDPLTSIANRRKFNNALNAEINRDVRYQNGLTLIICDLDHFKNINDIHGHNIGDEVLIEFTELISENIRNSDIFARWGGEEFIILLPETHLETAVDTAEKLRKICEQHHYPYVGNITASFGVTQLLKGDTDTTFINRADDALYKAKEDGRNKVDVLPPLRIPLRACSD